MATETARSAENLPAGSLAIIKRYISHNKVIKELSQKYMDAARANEWGEATEYCREILTEIDRTIGDIKGAPGKMSSTIATRIICSCLATLVQSAILMKSNGTYFNQTVWQGITRPIIDGTPSHAPRVRADMDTAFALMEGQWDLFPKDPKAASKSYAMFAGFTAAMSIGSDTIRYIRSHCKDDVESIDAKDLNPVFQCVISDLERVKKSYLRLMDACAAERDAQVDEAIDAYIDKYIENFETYSDAMEGATIDAFQTFKEHLKQAKGLRGQLNKLRKAGKLKEAADVAQQLSKIAGETVRDIDLIPDDATVPWLMDIAVMFLGMYINSAIMDATVGRFFNYRLKKKAGKLEAAHGAGTDMAKNAINDAAVKSMKIQGNVQLMASMFMGNPLGALLNKLSQKASGDKEEWGDNDRNAIINCLRLQAKHVRDKYAKLASELRSGKDPKGKGDKAVESFSVFGLAVEDNSAMENEALEAQLHDALGDENWAVYESYLDSISDDDWCEAVQEGYCLALDEFEESALENEFFVSEALEGQSAKKDVKAIFKRFKKEIRSARSEMKACDKNKDYAGAAAAAQKAADISKSMLQECDAVPPDTKGAVLSWIGFIAVEVLLGAVVITLSGVIGGMVKDFPTEVDRAYHRTAVEVGGGTAKSAAKKGIHKALSKKLNLPEMKPYQRKSAAQPTVGDAAKMAINPARGGIAGLKKSAKGAVSDVVSKQIGKALPETMSEEMRDRISQSITKNGGKAIKNTLTGKGAKQGRAIGGALIGGAAGFDAAKRISKTAKLLFQKKAMKSDGTIEGSNLTVNDLHPVIAAMKSDIAKAIQRYEAYAKMYRQRGKTGDIKSGSATESWLFNESDKGWLFN